MVRLERRPKPKNTERGWLWTKSVGFFFLSRIHNVEKWRRLLGAEKCFRLSGKEW